MDGPTTSTSTGQLQQRGGLKLNKLGRFLTLTVGNIVFMVLSSVIIHQYDPKQPATATRSKFTIFDHTFTLPPLVARPPPAVFMFAGIFYMSALSSFPVPPNDDPYQIYFIALGGIAAHFLAANHGYDDARTYFMALKSYLPISVTIALVNSLMVHAVLRTGKRTGVKTVTEETGKKES